MKVRSLNIILICLMVYDAVAMAFSYFFGLWLRFDFVYSEIPAVCMHRCTWFIPFYIIFSIVLFYFIRMYKSIWSFAGFHELLRYTTASFIASLFYCFAISIILGRMPIPYYIAGMILQLLLLGSIRFFCQIYRRIFKRRNREEKSSSQAKNGILSIRNETGRKMKTLSGIYQLANDEVTVSSMKPVALEDFLAESL